jgi:lipopolysaccharide cholinephosphotransferase
MGTICLEELKKIELDILIYIDQVCEKNNLRYFLCGGTLLGAIRHKGFIPWDDDIDISMPRPDYDKFVKILKEADNKYKILTPEQEDYYYNFSKVVDSETILNECNHQTIDNMGVYVDVFPLEGMPIDQDECEKHFIKLDKIRKRINSFSYLKPSFRKNIIHYIKHLNLYKKNKKSSLTIFQKEYEQCVKKYNYDESDFIYATGGAYGRKDIFPKEMFLNFIKVEFEGASFFVPQEFDAYLKHLYGDYMKLPPIEKRVSNHNYEAKYRRDKE